MSKPLDNLTAGGAQGGQAYWRSLEEYAGSDELQARFAEEFPGYDPEQIQSLSRRGFLKLAGASMALAGLTLAGCRRWPEDQIAPFASRPNGRTPGEFERYATIYQRSGVAYPLLVTCIDGRPIKVEGNPEHPYGLHASDVFAQASILELYDPDRSRAVTTRDGEGYRTTTWPAFGQLMGRELAEADPKRIAILSEPTCSPTQQRLVKGFLDKFDGAQQYTYSPIADAPGPARTIYDVAKAKVIACFGSDLLGADPNAQQHAAGWAAGRRSVDTEGEMNRLYVAEPSFTITGSAADERLAVRQAELPTLLLNLQAALRGSDISGDVKQKRFIARLAADLNAHRGESLVTVGRDQPLGTQVLVQTINQQLGNVGKTLAWIDRPEQHGRRLDVLVKEMNAGNVDALIILGGNPVYDTPGDAGFAAALGKVKTAVHLSLYHNETSAACKWHLPEAHAFEVWSDGKSWDGTLSVQQPLIKPLFEDQNRQYGGRSASEVLALLLGEKQDASYGLVRKTWQADSLSGEGFESRWRKVLHAGFLEGSSGKKRQMVPTPMIAATPGPDLGDQFELVFREGAVYDGRYANVGWLQETPDPITKATWGNPLLVSFADGAELGLKTGDVVRIEASGKSVEMPVFISQGQAKRSLIAHVGFGRPRSGNVGTAVGVDVNVLRTSTDAPVTATIAKTGKRAVVATTVNHHLVDPAKPATGGKDWVAAYGLEERAGKRGESGKILKEASLEEFARNPGVIHKGAHGDVSLQLYESPFKTEPKHPDGPEAFNDPHAWGMTIDTNACIGCNACVVSCYAENNIPVVGEDQVVRSREMAWLRIDTYFKGDPAGEVDVVHQPIMCVQCENAPCEQVCPVAATVHDTEGLNTMVYNRCIGTRYCSNNCPYKVRRFNYFDYHSIDPRGTGMPGVQANPYLDWPDKQQHSINAIRQMAFNPDVTVRMRGVMEKCTYCTQRIARAKMDARNEWARGERATKLVQEGEVMTACQSACPTQAITFGDLNDPNSAVMKQQKNKRAYAVLEELNTRPRTKHLAKIRNPKT